jgi:hypothetical protein
MRPPDRKSPERAQTRPGLESGSLGRRAGFDSTAYRVVAIKSSGARIIAGRFATMDDAERNAGILRRLARLTGGDVVVERDGGAR